MKQPVARQTSQAADLRNAKPPPAIFHWRRTALCPSSRRSRLRKHDCRITTVPDLAMQLS
jgi:hypothetical protein